MKKAFEICRKEILEIGKSRQTLIPFLILPLMFGIMVPLIIVSTPMRGLHAVNITKMKQALPEMQALTNEQASIYYSMNYVMPSLFVLIPLILPVIIAPESIAGEKERKTIEAFLTAPITDKEILLGKTLTAFVPSIGATWIAFSAFVLIADIGTAQLFHYLLVPNATWIFLMLILAPLTALFGTGAMVIASSYAKTVKDAAISAIFIITPFDFLVIGIAVGILRLSLSLWMILSLILLFVDLLLFGLGSKALRREEILTRLV